MPMPSRFDYETRIRNWRKCVSDPELCAGEPHHTPDGKIWKDSGTFAIVFKFKLASGEFKAVRCFISEMEGIKERYEAISAHLAEHPLESLVGFEFIPDAILTADGPKPIIKMSWAEGLPLDQYLKRAIAGKAVQNIKSLEERWLKLMHELAEHEIGHGDLHPSNILVSAQGDIILVDYDGLHVPALKDQPSAVLGLQNFIHPRRTSQDYGPTMDRFSGWLLLITLRALSHQPGLWDKHEAHEKKLLFSQEDLEQPEQTAVWADLARIDDQEFSGWLEQFAAACRGLPAETPELPRREVPLRDLFLRARSTGDEFVMLLLWDQGASEIAELQPYATRVEQARATRIARPNADPWDLFRRARSVGDRRAMLSLWPAVQDRAEAKALAGPMRRLADQMRQQTAPKKLDPLAELRRALSVGDELGALMIWNSAKDHAAAKAHEPAIAQLRRKFSLPD